MNPYYIIVFLILILAVIILGSGATSGVSPVVYG